MNKLFSFLIIILCFLHCDTNEQQVNFYHWSQTLNLSEVEQNTLEKTKTQKLYTRFFDVTWDNYRFEKPVPASVISITNLPKEVEIVPVVYITEETMKKIDSTTYSLQDFANRVYNKINAIAKEHSIELNEIQIDCDWTESSESNYFRFLSMLKKRLNKEQVLSATIRLHQVKYKEQTGIPPVDKGVLMVYNMGKITDEEEQNSIFNKTTTQQYLYGFNDYELPLNLALPAFSWVIHFKDQDIQNVLADVSPKLLDSLPALEKIEFNRYRATRNTMVKHWYVPKGSTLRLESAQQEDLEWALQTFDEKIKNKANPYEIIFYHIGSANVQSLPNQVYEN